MKTKIYLLLVLFLPLQAISVHAKWYPNATLAINNSNCPEDLSHDLIGPTDADIGFAPAGDVGYPYFQSASAFTSYQARASGVLGAVVCEYWDSTSPLVSGTGYSYSWRNTNFTGTLFASDVGGSNISTAKYFMNLNNAVPAGLINITYCLANGTAYANGYGLPITTEGDHTLYLCAQDVAGNQSFTWSGVYRLDKTKPVVSGFNYTNGWGSGNTVALTWTGSDTGGSGLQDYTIRVYRVAGAQNNPVLLFQTITVSGSLSSTNYPVADGFAYKFEICARDAASNGCTASDWLGSPSVSRIDMVLPNPANLTSSLPSSNLQATTTQNFSFAFNDGGAPVNITSKIEDVNNPAGWTIVFSPSPFGFTQTSIQDIHIVDGADRLADGGAARQYTYTVTQICDQAGNCWNGTKNFTYNVYANTFFSPTISPDFSGLTNAVADGQPRTVSHTFKDFYNNAIIPATGISRTVSEDLSSITNTMFLDQYHRAGVTSVYLRSPASVEVPLSFGLTQSLGNQTSTNGVYSYTVKSYTPTANSYASGASVSDPLATFTFTTNLTVNDTLSGTLTLSGSSHVFNFAPLFTSKIHGDLENGGFIEGAEQSNSIDINQDVNASGLASPSAFNLELEFGGTNAANFSLFANSTSPVSTSITSAKSSLVSSPAVFPVGGYPFFSQLVQNPNVTVQNLSNIYLSTHLSYTLNGTGVTINSDVIGKNGGYFGTGIALGNQVGIKIIGSFSTKNTNSLVTDQFASGVSMFNTINRGAVREMAKKNIAIATRNTTLSPVGSTVSAFSSLPVGAGVQGVKVDQGANKSIMVLQKTGGNIVLSTSSISGVRTLVVRGANLYVTSDMNYADKQSMLGIVIQKDDNGNGGNLYIDPSVTNLVGTYVIDGSVISYDGVSELGYNTPISTLKNQLYIYGSIVSENTIGGSRLSLPLCPSLLNISPCTLQTAQKYDLNYLRRYYLTSGQPFGGAKVIGGGICDTVSCYGFTPGLKNIFTAPTDDLAKYPTIIEYNPLVQTLQPIGFETILQ